MVFCDPGPQNWQTAAALDVISHEYSHGITQYTSDLIYSLQSGALNETFSDIMGTAVEQYWQDPGQGFDRSDWVVGEDTYSSYGSNNYVRNLADPNALTFAPGAPYPCHLSQFYVLPNTEEGDWGGVHFNCTIYSHAYYLLSQGGTNRISGLSVSGIGIDRATKIFYRAWTYYLVPSSDFLYAANALLQSAYDLYGSSSNEFAQTINAMEAIGWIVN
jgi:thermolysin